MLIIDTRRDGAARRHDKSRDAMMRATPISDAAARCQRHDMPKDYFCRYAFAMLTLLCAMLPC